MELTREYFDQGLANLVEKMATKDDLILLEQRLVDYIEEVGQIIIEAVAFNFDKVEKRLDSLELAIKPINTNAYQVKEASPGIQTERLPNLHELVVAAMAKRGRKWPSNPSGQKAG
jgi:hypothetical protein